MKDKSKKQKPKVTTEDIAKLLEDGFAMMDRWFDKILKEPKKC